MAISAPLIVLARPIGLLLWGLPQRSRRGLGAAMRTPLITRSWNWCTGATSATTIHGVAIWGWHLPFLFDAAVTNTAMHRLQHLSFFATAILFWWAVVWKSDYGASAWHLFVTMVHTSILGALMALAPRVLYVAQTQTAAAWGLTPLEDQQLAGMIMWVPAGTIYAAASITMLAVWIAAPAREEREMPDALISSRRAGWVAAIVGAGLGALIITNVVRDHETKTAAAVALTGGDPSRAPALFRRYGCSGCHTIPGIPGADGQAGAPLAGLSKHVYIAGMLENRSRQPCRMDRIAAELFPRRRRCRLPASQRRKRETSPPISTATELKDEAWVKAGVP